MSDALHTLSKEMRAAMELARSLGDISEDLELKRDTIEGETGLHDAIGAALDLLTEQEIMRDGLASKIEELTRRKSAFDARIDGIRASIEQAMTIGEIGKLTTPTATLSLSKTAPKPTITDEALIPAKFWKQPDPVLNKSAINDAIKAGEFVPGVTKSNGGVALKVRRI